jgi:hypothetical protein
MPWTKLLLPTSFATATGCEMWKWPWLSATNTLLGSLSLRPLNPSILLSMATFPTLHLNGTGKITLRDEYAAAYDAIDKAIDALVAATLNGTGFTRKPKVPTTKPAASAMQPLSSFARPTNTLAKCSLAFATKCLDGLCKAL